MIISPSRALERARADEIDVVSQLQLCIWSLRQVSRRESEQVRIEERERVAGFKLSSSDAKLCVSK